MQTLSDGPAYRPLPETYPYAGRDTFWQFPSQLDDDTCDERFPWGFWSSQARDDYAERAAARQFDRTELRPVYVGGIPARLLHSMHARGSVGCAARAAAKPDWWYFPGRGWSVWLQFPHELTGPHRDPMRWAGPSARDDYARRKAERMLDLVERPPFVGGIPAEFVWDMDGWFVQLGL